MKENLTTTTDESKHILFYFEAHTCSAYYNYYCLTNTIQISFKVFKLMVLKTACYILNI